MKIEIIDLIFKSNNGRYFIDYGKKYENKIKRK